MRTPVQMPCLCVYFQLLKLGHLTDWDAFFSWPSAVHTRGVPLYMGNPSIWTLLGQKKVGRCPYFRVHKHWRKKVSCLERCPYFRGVLIEGFHCSIMCCTLDRIFVCVTNICTCRRAAAARDSVVHHSIHWQHLRLDHQVSNYCTTTIHYTQAPLYTRNEYSCSCAHTFTPRNFHISLKPCV